MKTEKPLKRHKSLQPFSREHHHTLLLSWKIRTGFHKNIDLQRIKTYVDWFYENHIKTHFDLEEKYIYPILDSDHEYIKKAIAEHRRLQRLFEDKSDIERSLSLLEEELEQHIRFEERVLFPEVQKFATEEQLRLIDQHHNEVGFQENIADRFWELQK